MQCIMQLRRRMLMSEARDHSRLPRKAEVWCYMKNAAVRGERNYKSRSGVSNPPPPSVIRFTNASFHNWLEVDDDSSVCDTVTATVDAKQILERELCCFRNINKEQRGVAGIRCAVPGSLIYTLCLYKWSLLHCMWPNTAPRHQRQQ